MLLILFCLFIILLKRTVAKKKIWNSILNFFFKLIFRVTGNIFWGPATSWNENFGFGVLNQFATTFQVSIYFSLSISLHPTVGIIWGRRRRIKTKEKAKVVASVWGEGIVYSILCRAPGWYERKGWNHPFLLDRPRQKN